MQLRYVTSELGNGLRRNMSMTVSIILTIWMSVTLAGLGLMVRAQVDQIEQQLGSLLEIEVQFCGPSSNTAPCVTGPVTGVQRDAVEKVIQADKDVDSYYFISQQMNYENYQSKNQTPDGEPTLAASLVKVQDMPTAFRVKMNDPQTTDALISEVHGMPGVNDVFDPRTELQPVYQTLNVLKWGALGAALLLVVAAVLQVSTMIRMAVMARRREIGIMRLVGAGSLYIQLPFLLEIVVAAAFGTLLAVGTVFLGLTQVRPWLVGHVQLWHWVDVSDLWPIAIQLAIGALVLAIVPTLVLTRKYLKV